MCSLAGLLIRCAYIRGFGGSQLTITITQFGLLSIHQTRGMACDKRNCGQQIGLANGKSDKAQVWCSRYELSESVTKGIP